VSTRERILHRVARSDFARSAYQNVRRIPLLGACVQKLTRAALPPGEKLWARIPSGRGKGLWIYTDPRFELGYANGDHEPWLQELLEQHLSAGDCYYDVGAHTGFFSLIASRFVGPSGKIVALEPDPENAATFRAIMSKNGVEQATLLEAAVWSSPGEVVFERALDASNRTQGHIGGEANSRLARIAVPAETLDELIFKKGYAVPNLMKMDIEGAEWAALQGAKRMLGEAKPKLLCEVHDPSEMGKIQDYLKEFGYAAEEWRPVHEHYSDYRQLYLWATPALQARSAGANR
jgi:FkbM family methyltransferase